MLPRHRIAAPAVARCGLQDVVSNKTCSVAKGGHGGALNCTCFGQCLKVLAVK